MSAYVSHVDVPLLGGGVLGGGLLGGLGGITTISIGLALEWDGVSVIRLTTMSDVKRRLCVPYERRERIKERC